MAIKINAKNTFVYSALLFCIIALSIVVIHAIGFSNKGFELSDETFYLFFTLNFNSETFVLSNFGLLNKLSCFNEVSLVNLRLAKFIYQSLAVVVFVFSLFKLLNFRKYIVSNANKSFIMIIALMTSYCNYDYLPMTLSYNTWSLILMLFCFSIIFIEYTINKKSYALITSVVFGFLCFGLFLVKFPNAFIAVFFYFVFNVFSIKSNFWYKFLGLVIGGVIGYLVFLNNLGDLKNIIINYYAAIFEVKHVQANSYLTQVVDFLILCYDKQFLLVELLVILTAVIVKKYVTVYKTAFIFLVIIFNYYLSSFFFKGNSVALYNDFIAGSIFIINIFLFVFMANEKESLVFPRKEEVIIVTSLFVMPVCLMLGTNNLFYYTSSQTMVFSIIAALIYLIYSNQLNASFLAIKCVVVCIFILSILKQGAVETPYRQNNLLAKKYPLHFSEALNGINESYEAFVDYNVINELTKKLNPSNRPVLTFFNHFGVHYLTGNRIFPDSQISDAEDLIIADEYVLTKANFDDSLDLLIIPETVENSAKFKAMFSRFGVNLGENYKMVFMYEFLSTHEKVYMYKKLI